MVNDSQLLSVEGITKTYVLWSSPFKRVAQAIASCLPGSKEKSNANGSRHIEALKGVSFTLNRGESIGIIGRNGSGKSTLLEILAGTLQATSGTRVLKGRIGALLELGSGFHSDFTGNENLRMALSLLGVSRKEAKRLEPEIIAFAELEHAMDQPIKTYSQGMVLRLAFAIQTSIKLDILLIDEILAVGDVFFQQKCAERVKALQAQGMALILVSHDTGAIKNYCQKAIFLNGGSQVYYGDVIKAIHYYHLLKSDFTENEIIPGEERGNQHISEPINEDYFWKNEDQENVGNSLVKITQVSLYSHAGKPTRFTTVNERIRFRVHFLGKLNEYFILCCRIKNSMGQLVVELGSHEAGTYRVLGNGARETVVEFDWKCSLHPGEYSCCFVAILNNVNGEVNRLVSERFESPWIGPLQIVWNEVDGKLPFHGMFGPEYVCRNLTLGD